MYFEDLDLCERICRAGWQVVYVPAAVVIHEGGVSTSRDPRAMADAHHASAWRYLSRRYAGVRWAPVRLALRAGLAAPGRAGPPGARGGGRREAGPPPLGRRTGRQRRARRGRHAARAATTAPRRRCVDERGHVATHRAWLPFSTT